MNALREFFSREAGQARRNALENALQTYVAEPMNYLLGPSGIPDKLQTAGNIFEYTDAGDMQAAAQASNNLWNNPTIGNAAEYAAAGIALGLPFYSNALSEGIMSVADDMVAAYDPNTVGAFRVWHGSPHEFDKFSMDKIGTGEGAQAYGHGLYFAESPDVAKSYQTSNSATARMSYNGKPITDEVKQSVAWSLEQHRGDKDAVVDEWRRIFKPEFWETRLGKQQMRELNRMDYAKLRPGQIYEVAIDAEPEDFIDWDAPFSAQPQKVRDALTPRIEQLKAEGARYSEDPTGEMLWRSMHPQGGIDKFDFSQDPSAYAAGKLRAEGIPGIKYLDAGSRGAGEGSRNYVLFDDSLAHILSKNGEPQNTAEADRMRKLIDYLNEHRGRK